MKQKYLQIDRLMAALVLASVLYALYCTFLGVPNERVMGAVQRIFYFHVASAFASYCAFGLVFMASLGYLATRDRRIDAVLEASGEVGLLFCTILLSSGMIWGYVAWNTPFRLEPRLVSTLILWLIFLAFQILRTFGDPAKISAHSAVLGILGALTVPVVVYSIHLLPQFAQLHPQVVEQQGLKDPSFYRAMFAASGALILLQFFLIWLRARVAMAEQALARWAT